jgi:hypothetical protein
MSNPVLCPVLKQQFVDQNGLPYAGGQLFSYTAGTSTPQVTYTDETGATPNTNPIILDAAGRANVWLGSGAYKFVLEDVNSNVIWTVDQVSVTSNGSNLGSPNTFTIADNQSSAQNITGLLMVGSTNGAMTVEYTIIRSNGSSTKRREHGFLYFGYDSVNGYVMIREIMVGVDSLNKGSNGLTITSGGQVQYETDSMGGTYAGQMTWQVVSAFAAEGI